MTTERERADALMAQNNQIRSDRADIAVERNMLAADNAKLREALKPFAAVAMDSALSDHPDSYAPRPARGSPDMRAAMARVAEFHKALATRKTSRFVEMEQGRGRPRLWRAILIGTPIALVLWLLIFEVVR